MSLEVDLVGDVKACKKCSWFWGGIPPYGPFPSFDWQTMFPEPMVDSKPQTHSTKPKKWMKAPLIGAKQIDPAIMYGCRKAPIMTIGINPNMTSYFPSTNGATWAYPNFSEAANYAYYYRHHTIYQESLSLNVIRKNIAPGSEIKATGEGWLLGVERGSDHRWMILTVRYKGRAKPVQYEAAWALESRTVILVKTTREKDIATTDPTLKKGDIIAGNLIAPDDIQAEVYENGVSYYQRFVNVLRSFEGQLDGVIPTGTLRIGEDVCQHDMIGCASPGWSSKYDIPTAPITQNCVLDKAYVVSQFVQSQPKVLVIVGGSSLAMFAQAFAPFMDLDFEGEDIYSLMKETVKRRHYVSIDIDGVTFKTRIITSPHFSYGANFYKQSRFSREAWTAFQKDFSRDFKTLTDLDLVSDPAWNGVIAIKIDVDDKVLKRIISTAGWDVIRAYYFDPFEMMGEALADEYHNGGLGYDAQSNRLIRTKGPCDFCTNDVWEFPEGCAYKSNKIKPYKEGALGGVVRKILKQAQKQSPSP
ncbi:MAG: hypothetical protein JKY92_04975 [Magnetovibrio sp.]|nr:hypothetical protein [Magnetovibrio sp.]